MSQHKPLQFPPMRFFLHDPMIPALTILLIYQLIGEVMVRWLQLPVPGPVLGMALLLTTFIFTKGPSQPLKNTANGLLQHLSLLFVPAGTGVMLHFQRLGEEWLALLVAVAISTVLSIAVSSWLLTLMTRRIADREQS